MPLAGNCTSYLLMGTPRGNVDLNGLVCRIFKPTLVLSNSTITLVALLLSLVTLLLSLVAIYFHNCSHA